MSTLEEPEPAKPREPTAPQRFRDALEASAESAAAVVAEVHAADAVAWLQDVGVADAWRVFDLLPTQLQADLLAYADEGLRRELVSRMSAADLAGVVEELPTDEAVDILADAEDHVAAHVLEAIPDETANELRQLAAHHPETAGGVMTADFVTASVTDRIGDAVKAVKQQEDADESLGVFVVDEDQVPVGYLSDRALLTHSIHEPIKDVMVEPFLVSVDEDQEEAASVLTKYGLDALAVVGDGGQLVGVISADDAQDILAEEASEDMLRMVGTAPALQTRLPVLTRVRQRLPLMGVTVAGGLASAKLLGWALGSGEGGGLADAILRYLPLIVGLAGNVGVQSSTILVRAFATGEVDRERDVEVLLGEVSVGAVIGVICGVITVGFAGWMEGAELGWAVGTAIAVAVTWAALLGCVVPMGCRRLGIDPAIVAGPFLICLSDISGVLIYILVANSLVMGLKS